jgi:voltage-gated potassium channel
VARAVHMFRSQDRRGLVADVLANRGEYAGLVATAAVITVLTVSSVLVLQAESKVSGANIVTGGDSLWWAVVTLTTVGYGNLYPVTAFGRVVSVFVMFAGVGIIGALASIMASLLIPTPKAAPAAASETTRDEQLDEVLRELKEIRQLLGAGRQDASDAS